MQVILVICAFVITILFQCYEGRTISVLSVSMVEAVKLEEAPVELPSPSHVPSESSNIVNLATQ